MEGMSQQEMDHGKHEVQLSGANIVVRMFTSQSALLPRQAQHLTDNGSAHVPVCPAAGNCAQDAHFVHVYCRDVARF